MKERIAQLISEGKSYNEIQKIIGCSKGTISYHTNPLTKSKYQLRQRVNRKKWITDLKNEFGGKCSRCGYDKCLAALDFHHSDPSSKIDSVSKMIGRTGIQNAREEAQRCVLLCSNCHRELYQEERIL